MDKVIKHIWEVCVGVDTGLEALCSEVVFLLDGNTLLQLQSTRSQTDLI